MIPSSIAAMAMSPCCIHLPVNPKQLFDQKCKDHPINFASICQGHAGFVHCTTVLMPRRTTALCQIFRHVHKRLAPIFFVTQGHTRETRKERPNSNCYVDVAVVAVMFLVVVVVVVVVVAAVVG